MNVNGQPRRAAAQKGARASILFVAPSAKFFLSHRLPLALGAQAAGFEATVACPQDADCLRIAAHGIGHVGLPVHRGGLHPWRDARTLWRLHGIMRMLRPDVVHLITAKPALLGGLAARWLGSPTVTAITGLGSAFMQEGLIAKLVQTLLFGGYRTGLGHRENVFIFQNHTDMALFQKQGLLVGAAVRLIPGSGVDLQRITPQVLPDGPPLVLMPSRMLRDKGVMEFAEAARLLIQQGWRARFRLLGDPDLDNPTSLTQADLRAIERTSPVEWHPHSADIAGQLAAASIVALPSYREGFPKSLIDAAAAGRVCVATDVPGCRDAVLDGVTGLLCQPRNPDSLAQAIASLLNNPERMARMGAAARQHAERHFDIANVVEAHLTIYQQLSGINGVRPDLAEPIA